MKVNGNIAEEVLVKYLLNEATEAERMQVQGWLTSSEANKAHLEQLRILWAESGKLASEGDIDTDEAWARFKQRTNRPKRTLPMPSQYKWVKVAAVLAVGCLAGFLLMNREAAKQPVANIEKKAPINAVKPEQETPIVEKVATVSKAVFMQPISAKKESVHHKTANATVAVKVKSKFKVEQYSNGFFKYDRTKDFICNNTPCPIEICIKQKVQCPNGQTEDVSTCSVLEPDESGQLRYKAFDRLKHSCSTTVDEIRIKRVSTGETIVLNADSKPATAQEFFSYITGQKKGDITAGIFHTDCNNNVDDCGLTFNNSNLILQ